MNYVAGQDISFIADYLVDGVFVVPDTAAYQLRAHDGTLLVSTSLPAIQNSEVFNVDAAYNGIGGDPFQHRYLVISFIHEGVQHTLQKSYTLIPFTPMTATPEKVRAEIGLDALELPDQDVDLFAAYLELVSSYGSSITTALTATGPTNLAVNKAIVAQAALNISNSLELRTVISARSEDSSTRRSTTIDFDKIVDRMRGKLSTLLDTVSNSTVVAGSIFQVSDPTDAITG